MHLSHRQLFRQAASYYELHHGVTVDAEQAYTHYLEHDEKPPWLVIFCEVMVVEHTVACPSGAD